MTDIIDTALRRMIDQKRYDCGAACCEWSADGDAEEALVAYRALRASAEAAEARVTALEADLRATERLATDERARRILAEVERDDYRRMVDDLQRDDERRDARVTELEAALTAVKAWLNQEEEVGLGVPDILWDIILAAAPTKEGAA